MCGSGVCYRKGVWQWCMLQKGCVAVVYVTERVCGSGVCYRKGVWQWCMLQKGCVAVVYVTERVCGSGVCYRKGGWQWCIQTFGKYCEGAKVKFKRSTLVKMVKMCGSNQNSSFKKARYHNCLPVAGGGGVGATPLPPTTCWVRKLWWYETIKWFLKQK